MEYEKALQPPEKSTKEFDLVSLDFPKKNPNSTSSVAYATALSAATICFVAALVVNVIAGLPIGAKIGLKNTTADVSDKFYTQVTPAGWTFAIWSVIYIWQIVLLVYGWTFTSISQSSAEVPFSSQSLVLYACVNVCNIIWILLWGYEFPQYSFPVIFILELLLYAAIRNEAQYLFQLEDSAKHFTTKECRLRFDLNFARYLILNGMSIYASWITVANLINLAIVLEYYGPFSASFAGTVSLVLLAADVVMYFILENTVVGNFAQYVFVVYPTLIWATSGVVYAHAKTSGGGLNELIALVLLVGSVFLLIAKTFK